MTKVLRTSPSQNSPRARGGFLGAAHKVALGLCAVLAFGAGSQAKADAGQQALGLAASVKSQTQYLGQVLRAQGWSVISTAPNNPPMASPVQPNSTYSGAVQGVTGLIQEISPVSVPMVRAVVANALGTSAPNDWVPNDNPIYVDVGFWNGTLAVGARFAGQRLAKVDGGDIAISDPVPFVVTAATAYPVRSYCGVNGVALYCPTRLQVSGGATGFSPTSTEGATPENAAEMFSTGITASSSYTVFSHTAILGYTGLTPAPSLACAGDSILSGNDDGGAAHNNGGGWCERAAQNATSANVQWPNVTPKYGVIKVARSGDTLANFLTAGQSTQMLNLASLATTCIIDRAINDVSAGTALATIESNKVSEAVLFLEACPHVVATTLFPQTSSTDGWRTVGNQTTRTYEANRVGYNDWMRQAGASGFFGQVVTACLAADPCKQATGSNPAAHLAVYDVSPVSEVNASGVAAIDGGYWAANASCPYSGSVTTGSGTAQFFDTNVSPSSGQYYRGYTVVMTSGATSGQDAVAVSVNPSTELIIFVPALTGTPTAGDTYKLCTGIPTPDGTHPTSEMYGKVAADFLTKGLVQ